MYEKNHKICAFRLLRFNTKFVPASFLLNPIQRIENMATSCNSLSATLNMQYMYLGSVIVAKLKTAPVLRPMNQYAEINRTFKNYRWTGVLRSDFVIYMAS